jgi:hypothetical protein
LLLTGDADEGPFWRDGQRLGLAILAVDEDDLDIALGPPGAGLGRRQPAQEDLHPGTSENRPGDEQYLFRDVGEREKPHAFTGSTDLQSDIAGATKNVASTAQAAAGSQATAAQTAAAAQAADAQINKDFNALQALGTHPTAGQLADAQAILKKDLQLAQTAHATADLAAKDAASKQKV